MLIIRDLEEKDLDRVCELEEKSFSMPWKKEDFKKLIYDEGSIYLVLEEDGVVVGTAGYTDQVGEGYINNVVIAEEKRGKGYARTLMEAVLLHGKKKGIFDYTLEVRVSNISAINLYKGLGFENVGIRKRFYERPVEDAYVCWLHMPYEDREC